MFRITDHMDLSEGEYNKLVANEIEKFAGAIKRPGPNWQRIIFKNRWVEYYGGGKYVESPISKVTHSIVLINDIDQINLIFRICWVPYKEYLQEVEAVKRKAGSQSVNDSFDIVHVSGSTEQLLDGLWMSYDHRWGEKSFAINSQSKYKSHTDIPAVIKDQLDRVERDRKNDNTKHKLPVPLHHWEFTTKQINAFKSALESGEEVHFFPPHKGIFGKTLMPHPVSKSYPTKGQRGGPAPSVIEDLFGVSPLYIAIFDKE